jgi:hypothetical protein
MTFWKLITQICLEANYTDLSSNRLLILFSVHILMLSSKMILYIENILLCSRGRWKPLFETVASNTTIQTIMYRDLNWDHIELESNVHKIFFVVVVVGFCLFNTKIIKRAIITILV